MVRYKYYDYKQLVIVPVSLEDQLMPGTLEYAINHVVEERLDLSIFDERYRNEACKELGVDAFVPDPQFRKRDVRFADAGRHRCSVDRRAVFRQSR